MPLAKLRCGPLLTGEFMEKLKAIGAPHLRGHMSSRAPAIATLHLPLTNSPRLFAEGTSRHEAQEYTFETL